MRTGEIYKINFYTQIDSYIELATHFRLERLKIVSLQESNQSLSTNRNCKNAIDLKFVKAFMILKFKKSELLKLFRLKIKIPKIETIFVPMRRNIF